MAEVQQDVAAGRLRYILIGAGRRSFGAVSSVDTWVANTCARVDTGSIASTARLYDCAGAG